MHIITKARVTIAGRLVASGTVLDLPEAEVAEALASGDAVPWPEVVEAVTLADAGGEGAGGGSEGGGGGSEGGGSATVAGGQTLV